MVVIEVLLLLFWWGTGIFTRGGEGGGWWTTSHTDSCLLFTAEQPPPPPHESGKFQINMQTRNSSINEIFDHHPHHPPHSYSYMEYKFDIPSEGAIAITYGQQPELAHTHPFCTWITSVYSLNLSLFLSPISGYDSCLVTWEFQC